MKNRAAQEVTATTFCWLKSCVWVGLGFTQEWFMVDLGLVLGFT